MMTTKTEVLLPVKRESPGLQSHFLFSEMMPESVRELDTCLWNTSLACQILRENIHKWGADNGYLSEEQRDRITALEEEAARLRQDNDVAQAELQERWTNNDQLIGDMMHLCDEKQALVEERDNALFQKSVSDLILEQYRDETVEQREVIGARDVEVRDLANTCASLDTEASFLRRRCCHLEQFIAGEQQTMVDLRRELEESRARQAPNTTSTPISGTSSLPAESPTAAQLQKAKRKRKRGARRDRRRSKAGGLGS